MLLLLLKYIFERVVKCVTETNKKYRKKCVNKVSVDVHFNSLRKKKLNKK